MYEQLSIFEPDPQNDIEHLLNIGDSIKVDGKQRKVIGITVPIPDGNGNKYILYCLDGSDDFFSKERRRNYISNSYVRKVNKK